MTKINFKKLLSVTVIFALIAAMALTFTGCTQEEKTDTTGQSVTITVEIVDQDGVSTEYEITTDTGTLWGALQQEGLAEGDDSEYGVMIHTVCGVRADFTLDGAYWALYKDGEYLMSGAESTPIAEGEHYELVYTLA